MQTSMPTAPVPAAEVCTIIVSSAVLAAAESGCPPSGQQTAKFEINISQDATRTKHPFEGATFELVEGALVARFPLHPSPNGDPAPARMQELGSPGRTTIRDTAPSPHNTSGAAPSPAASSGVSYMTASTSPVGSTRSAHHMAPGLPTGNALSGARSRQTSNGVPGRNRSSGSIDNFTSWNLDLHTRKVKKLKLYTEWYESRGLSAVTLPPASLSRLARDHDERPFPVGRLYVHVQHKPGNRNAAVRSQAWMWKRIRARTPLDDAQTGGRRSPGRFIRIWEGDEHPKREDLVLNFAANGEPRWVRKTTARSYASKKKQNEHLERIQQRA